MSDKANILAPSQRGLSAKLTGGVPFQQSHTPSDPALPGHLPLKGKALGCGGGWWVRRWMVGGCRERRPRRSETKSHLDGAILFIGGAVKRNAGGSVPYGKRLLLEEKLSPQVTDEV